MENKQTAVEWLMDKMLQNENAIFIGGRYLTLYEIRERAKAREKQQIIDARVSGFASSAEGWNGEVPCMKWSEMVRETKCEEYYNETYGQI